MESRYQPNEDSPLLPSKSRRQAFISGLSTPLDRAYADIVLLINYAVTGLLDSSATIIWGAFVSMQTGNSIYLGLGLMNPNESTRWIRSGISIASFCVGSFCFARFHRAWGSERQSARAIIVGSYFLQLCLIVAAATILHFTPIPEPGDVHSLHWHVLLPLALVAFQSSGQTATSRALQHKALTSTVLTSLYCDLFSDANLFSGLSSNPTRNQRIAGPILLILGSAAGGWWSKTDIGVEGALWTAAVLKAGVVVAWSLWKANRKEVDGS